MFPVAILYVIVWDRAEVGATQRLVEQIAINAASFKAAIKAGMVRQTQKEEVPVLNHPEAEQLSQTP